MTIKSDALLYAKTFDGSGKDSLAKPIIRDLKMMELVVYQNSTLSPTAEAQSITPGDRDGGWFDMTITLEDGQSVFLNDVVWNQNSTNVQILLDIAAALSIDGYQAGDIVVAGGGFGTGGNATTFTFSGDSVAGSHPLIIIDGSTLNNGTVDPVPSQITDGHVGRFWFAALKEMGVITGTDPAFGEAPAGQYSVNAIDEIENYPSSATIRALIKEARVREGQDWEAELLPLLGYDD